jgi:hypothetical protein
LPFSNWLFPKPSKGLQRKVARATSEARAAGCRPLAYYNNKIILIIHTYYYYFGSVLTGKFFGLFEFIINAKNINLVTFDKIP